MKNAVFPRLVMVMISMIASVALASCGCNENALENGASIEACKDAAKGMNLGDGIQACKTCCIAQNYDSGSSFNMVGAEDMATCMCGNFMVCEES
jgi:hypothetical protein